MVTLAGGGTAEEGSPGGLVTVYGHTPSHSVTTPPAHCPSSPDDVPSLDCGLVYQYTEGHWSGILHKGPFMLDEEGIN